MIPTLFGVTIVSFCIMQLAPGDPLLIQLGPTGAAGQSSQTREAFLIQKRDLKLDKPLVLNFNYFRNFRSRVQIAAHFTALTEEEIAQELPALAANPDDPQLRARLEFLRSLDIEGFAERLGDPQQQERLAEAIQAFVQIWCEDTAIHGVPPAIALLRDPQSGLTLRIGLIRALNSMVIDPFRYTYSHDPSPGETPEVTATWATWWERAKDEFPEIAPDRRRKLAARLEALAAETSRSNLFEEIEDFQRDDMRLFAERLLGDSTLREKVVASLGLRLYIGKPLRMDVPRDADQEMVDRVAENWGAFFDLHKDEYEPGFWASTWYIVGDTQYAHMVWRLVTFNFGRSALKTREPVGEKILDAVLVSAPLMIMANLMIYLVAVPLGILCAVNRGNVVDRLITLVLFLLYSIPPFVAGMLFLLFFCYGEYLKWFPMLGLHSEGAQQFGYFRYILDYLWHAFLPVTCLSLFSLAGMAMYSRTSMLDVVGQDYIRTARAKGLSEPVVIMKHGLRNALIPIITLFSGFLPAMLGGSVLIEYIFGIPGMGRLSWESILYKDIPTLMALIYINAIVVMISILLTDLLYVFVDPRIGFGSQGQTA